jgi:hypothetical protein
MTGSIFSALIAALGAVVAAAMTYLFTKSKEREADWRKEKIAHYKAFIESLSGIVEGDVSDEGLLAFTKSVTNLLLVAPQSVLLALYNFRDEISQSNPNRSSEKHDKLLATLIAEIRKDLKVQPNDDLTTFQPRLYASGIERR